MRRFIERIKGNQRPLVMNTSENEKLKCVNCRKITPSQGGSWHTKEGKKVWICLACDRMSKGQKR